MEISENIEKIYYKKDFMNHSFSRLYLWVDKESNMIYFEVKDDGLGSNAKKVMDGTPSGGVGLTNTDKRLKSIFGPGSGLRILSN